MGIESRDRYREVHRKPRTHFGLGLVAAVVLAGALAAVSPAGTRATQLVAGGPTVTTSKAPGDDRWAKWLAPESVCPGGDALRRSTRQQSTTMLCLINYARKRQGLRGVTVSALLSRTSTAKALEIARCHEFGHEPCGRPANRAVIAAGYRGSWGENLYMATGTLAAPRVAIDCWLNSPAHRKNLFKPRWRTVGIARLADASVQEIDGGVIWVNQFGD
jgi:uncharacterized protein YkwD